MTVGKSCIFGIKKQTTLKFNFSWASNIFYVLFYYSIMIFIIRRNSQSATEFKE